MEPIQITATIPGPIALPGGPLAIDALLMATQARLLNLPPVEIGGFAKIEIPIAVEPGGRFHLASFSIGGFEAHDRHWLNRRFPIEQAQTIGTHALKRIRITAGAQKSYRIPMEVGYLVDSRLDWFATGDATLVRELLAYVTHVGKRRGVGKGEVTAWSVHACEAWPGFPVVRDGLPLRPLPQDWPGLIDPTEVAYRTVGCVDGPYWDKSREELCAVP